MSSRCTGSLLLVAALLAGCSGSSSTTSEASPAASTSVTAPAAPTTAPTTVAPTTTPAPTTTTAPPASITPFTVCVDWINSEGAIERGTDAIYFGYEVSGSQPVVVAEGPDNALNDTLREDDPKVPTVFAPGRVELAFLAVTSIDGGLPSWTVRGPDGVARTAAADESTPFCTAELLATAVPDARQLDVAYAIRSLPEGAPTIEQIEVTATVSGLPELSICPAGLDPRPPLVQLDLGDSRTTGTTGRVIVDVATFYRQDFVSVPGVQIRVAVRVVDVCGSGDAVSESWPINRTLAEWTEGGNFCVEVTGATAAEIACFRLNATGGFRATR